MHMIKQGRIQIQFSCCGQGKRYKVPPPRFFLLRGGGGGLYKEGETLHASIHS